MKSKEFKTSLGEFVIVDDIDTESLAMYEIFDNPKIFKYGLHLKPISKLSEITEDQAKEILGDMKFNNFGDYLPTNKLKLEALIKSLGINLYRNPLGKLKDYRKNFKGHDMFYSNYIDKWDQENKVTFYNPYIFKKI